MVFDYTYDPVDNLTSVTDSIDGVDKGVETFTYDELDRVTSITQGGDGVTDKRVDMAYDAASQMSSMTRYSDLAGTEEVATSTYTYDGASRLTDLVHEQNTATIAEFGLVYDQGDRITQFTTPDGVSDFTYDDTDQLVDASHNYQENENYSYDDNGNRTNTGYVTGDNNQLLSDGTYNYEYDNEGNRVKQTAIADGEVTEYKWDHRNRLVATVTKDSTDNITANSEYIYDVYDDRIGKSVDADGDGAGEAVVERYILDGDHIALTFDGEGNQTERFLHGTGIDQVIAQENETGEVLWALTDHQNSIRVVLDNDGNIVNQISYDSFGQITNQTNPDTDFRFSYTGRELDTETGLYYNRARYYDPSAGRFISEDPISFAAGDSNIYRYVGNNPLFYLDPSGFCGVGSSGGASGSPGAAGNPAPAGTPAPVPAPSPVPAPAPTPVPFPLPGGGNVSAGGGTGSSGEQKNNDNDFWKNAHELVFGEPAAAATAPPEVDLTSDSPNDIASDVIESSESNFNFNNDDGIEVASIAIPVAGTVVVIAGVTYVVVGNKLIRQDKKVDKETDLESDIWWYNQEQRLEQGFEKTKEFLQDSVNDLSQDISETVSEFVQKGSDYLNDVFNPNNINKKDQQQTDSLSDLKTPPQNTGENWNGQPGGFSDPNPGGIEHTGHPDDNRDLSPDHFEARKKRKSDDYDDPAEPLREFQQPKPNISGKEGAKDVPSWARGERPYVGESGNQFARRLLDAQYGTNKYKIKPGSEYNKIKKYGDRNFQ